MGEVVHRVIQLQGRVEEPAFTQLWCVRLAREDTLDIRLLHYGHLKLFFLKFSFKARIII